MEPCSRCQKIHTRCYGHRSGDGQPCQKYPIKGARVCGTHGGMASQVRARAAERVLQAEVQNYLRDMDIVPVTDPLRRLSELMGEADAFYRFVAQKVASLDVETWESFDDKSGVQLTAYVSVLERAMERVQKFLADMVRLGIEDRLARVDEKLAGKVIEALDAGMKDAGLSAEQALAVRKATGRHLRAVA